MYKSIVVSLSNSLKRFICFNIVFFSIVVSGHAQSALEFNGTDNYVEIPYAATNNPAQFTVELWARVDATGNHRSPLTSRGNTTGYLFYATPGDTWDFWGGNGSGWETLPGPAVVIGQWIHLAATYDGTSYRFYVDGILVNSLVAGFSMNTTSPMRIGAGRTESTPGYHFPGAVDEVKIWNYARSANQINDNKNVNLLVPQPGLMSYYQFEDGTATSKTGSNNGTLINSPTTVTGVSLTDLSSNADLSALTISTGTLSPSFASGSIAYTTSVSNATTSITVSPTKLDANATIQARVNGGGYATVASGNASGSLALNAGSNMVDVKVTAQDGATIKTYTITVTRGLAPLITNFNNVTKTYFDDSYTITAPTSNSSGVFTYTSDNPAVATISGTTVTITGTGTATITATQAGDATYNSGSATSTLTVNSVSIVTKNGKISTTNFNYINKNGALTLSTSLSINGQVISTKSNDGLTASSAGVSALQIKTDFPSAADGLYWISNPNINGGSPFQIYADMTTDGGGWILIMKNSSSAGWNYANAISLNTSIPFTNTADVENTSTLNYSIIKWANYLKKSAGGFQYMIDATTRRSYGGIWTANGDYSFVKTDNSQTSITLDTKFGTWNYVNDNGISKRMPWYQNASGFITTDNGGGNWWGTLISVGGWDPAPWISDGGGGSSNPYPGIIWYWVR
jgi:hypothetical protein